MKVAVIGAGAAGLVMARELKRSQQDVSLFEQSERVGGVWVYEAKVEDDLLGQNASQSVFSSLYDSLRTNLPRDLMAFGDYTFDSKGGGDDHWQRYPHHSKVLQYLEAFARDFDITPLVRFRQEVTGVSSDGSTGWWLTTNQTSRPEHFDAVVICNGHYSKAKLPQIEGINHFKGEVIHSHNYRNANRYKHKTVLVMGAAASGVDISREISLVAEEVIWCGARFSLPETQLPDGRRLFPNPTSINEQGEAVFLTADGTSQNLADIDVIMFCTGYEYQFPFLESDILAVDDNWVQPLYRDILHGNHSRLALLGIPYLIVPFPLFEMQAKWFASLLAGDWQLPSKAALTEHLSAKEKRLSTQFEFKRHYHQLGEAQAEYIDSLAEECGAEKLPKWFHELSNEAQNARLADPFNFRDQPMKGQGPTVVTEGVATDGELDNIQLTS